LPSQLASSLQISRAVQQCGGENSIEEALRFLVSQGVKVPASVGQQLIALHANVPCSAAWLEESYECEYCGQFRATWDLVTAHEAGCVWNPDWMALTQNPRLGQVHGRLFGQNVVRWDLKLELNQVVCAALQPVLDRISPLVTAILGPGARLVELAALVSELGATDQPVHSDTAWTEEPEVLTCFVALPTQ